MMLSYRRVYIDEKCMFDESSKLDISEISAEQFLEIILEDLAKEDTKRIILEVEN